MSGAEFLCDSLRRVLDRESVDSGLKTVSEYQSLANARIDEIALQFIGEDVIELIERSTSYSKIVRSADPIEFMDLTLIQWDTCTAGVLCLLRGRFREARVVPTQALLIRVCKLAARKVYERYRLVIRIEAGRIRGGGV
jgi:hypothetical protein